MRITKLDDLIISLGKLNQVFSSFAVFACLQILRQFMMMYEDVQTQLSVSLVFILSHIKANVCQKRFGLEFQHGHDQHDSTELASACVAARGSQWET